MIRQMRLTSRQWLIVLHDLTMTAAAIVATFFIRFEDEQLRIHLDGVPNFLPPFVVYAGFVYFAFGLYKAKWRFASLPDLGNIFRASTVLAVSLLVLDYILLSPNFYGTFYFGKITIVLYWVLQMAFLGGPRVAYRYFRYTRIRHKAIEGESAPTLILGRAADAEVLLRAIESGAVKKIWPVGILSPSASDQGQSIRGITVQGNFAQLESVVGDLAARGTRVARVVLTPSALAPDAMPETILMQARRLGLATSRLPSLDEGGEALRLAPVAVEDLLLRPSVKIDYRRLENFVKGKSVVVTGGGGSIGAEICDRVVAFGAARLLVLENSEPALYAVQETLATRQMPTSIAGRLADVRDRDRIFRLLADFKPDIVFHAAALKHASAETGWGEGSNQCLRLGQRCGCRGGGRRRVHGYDLDRQGDRAGFNAGCNQTLCRNVLSGARRRSRARGTARRPRCADLRVVRQCTGINGSWCRNSRRRSRLAGRHRHASGHGALLHDDLAKRAILS
jgi:O-antigen biosynthesis protein WbqV